MKFLVIADDFTGANDTGVQLAKKGARVDVSFNWQDAGSNQADVIVVNTESRALSQQEAKDRIKAGIKAQQPLMAKGSIVYKKIDSTFRGNVGAEVEAALEASNSVLAIVAAAIPAAGRTTQQGSCYVNGIPLLETEFASDPKTPIYSSKISEILQSQTKLPIYELSLEIIRSKRLADELNKLASQGRGIVVLDAENDADLYNVGQHLIALVQPYILVGAAGLANALPQSLYQQSKCSLPVLVVAGSMSEATRSQILFAAQDDNLDIIDINVENLINGQYQAELAAIESRAIATLANHRHCVLRTCRDEQAREQVTHLCDRYRLTRQQLGDKISETLGLATQSILQNSRVGGLFLTGGDIAIAVAKALDADGYRINQEVAPCIPCGTLLNSVIDDLPVITKAGGFGTKTTLRDSLYFIGEMYSGK